MRNLGMIAVVLATLTTAECGITFNLDVHPGGLYSGGQFNVDGIWLQSTGGEGYVRTGLDVFVENVDQAPVLMTAGDMFFVKNSTILRPVDGHFSFHYLGDKPGTMSPVPEPEEYMMLACLGLLGWAIYRKIKAKPENPTEVMQS